LLRAQACYRPNANNSRHRINPKVGTTAASAASAGYARSYGKLLVEDPDWDALRKDSRFIALQKKVQKIDAAGSPKEGDIDGDILDAD